jgi:hypothetical protein
MSYTVTLVVWGLVVGCGNKAIVLYRRRQAAAAKKTNEAADGRKKTKDGGRHISLAEAKQVFKLLFPVGQNAATKHIAYVAALCLCRTLLNDRVVSSPHVRHVPVRVFVPVCGISLCVSLSMCGHVTVRVCVRLCSMSLLVPTPHAWFCPNIFCAEIQIFPLGLT